MNAKAAAQLFSRPHIRRGIDYGFDADEAALIKADFPNVEIVYNLDLERLQVWAIGEYGAEPVCLYPSLPRSQVFKLRDLLADSKYEAANYKGGRQYGDAINADLAAENKAQVRAAVDAADPHRIGTEALDRVGRVKPVSMAVSP